MNQDIIVRVETGAPVSDFALQSVPQRSLDPRLPLVLVAVVIVGFIWWLGDQTPEQAVPVTPLPTPTTAPVFVIIPPTVPAPSPEAAVSPWITVLSSDVMQSSLSELDGAITLVHTAVETGQMTAIELGPDGVSTGPLRCGVASGSGFVSGEFPDHLVFELSEATCIVPRDGSAAPSVIENARGPYAVAESASVGWFCEDSAGQQRVAAYQVGGSLGSWIDAPACPYLADSGRLLVFNSQVTLRGATFAEFAPYWWKPGDRWTENPESIIGACEFVGIIGTRALCRDDEVVQIFDLLSGDLLAEPNYLVPPGALAVGTASPSGRYLFLQWLDPNSRSAGLFGGAVFDTESARGATPLPEVSGFVQTTWTSDEQLVMLITPRESDCEECASAIFLLDPATGLIELLLQVPPEIGEFSLQLIASG